ncbi:DMT family transporter [Sphingomonas sp.]|jgi:drug/metabolite transporter (DMT)-like permease|uniref:DMT family transporter n=1 Tax=Sphingomonas sp. TaxID=28214 RepID=UPI002ED830B8
MATATPLRGVFLFTLGLLLFACMDTTIKYLTGFYDVPVVVAARYIGNLLLMAALLGPRYGATLIRTKRTGLTVVRALCLASASLLVGIALQRMPVAETTAINFLAPTLVVLAAGPLLGERIGWMGWASALIGFGGVLLIVRPSSGLDAVGVACALLAVSANAGYQLLSRVLVATERTMALLFYTALTGSIIFGLIAPWFWSGRVPSLFEAALFASLGVYGGLGHFLITVAYRHAPASLLAPVNYLQLLWAGLLGWIIFGHSPDRLSLLGMAIVAASGAAVALRSRRPPVKREV